MNITESIRRGEIDCNDQNLFFKILIKGLILDLNNEIKIRDNEVPHIIIGTGDEYMYLDKKGYNHKKEPLNNTNENYVYNIIPRCNINVGGINLQRDQLTSPYSRGIFEIQTEDNIYNISAEFRRIPLMINIDLKYFTDTFTDMLQLIQQIITKLTFVRTFNIVYMGQQIKCSYSVPDSFDGEYLMDIDGTLQDNKNRNVSLSLEVSTNMPVFDNKTVVSTGKIITGLNKTPINIIDPESKIKGPSIVDAYNICNEDPKINLTNETKKCNYKTRAGD